MNRRRFLGALGAALASLVAACSGRSATSTTGAATTAAASTTSSSSTSAPTTSAPTTSTPPATEPPDTEPPATTEAPPTTVAPTVIAAISRTGWRARAATGDGIAHTIARLTVHHTAARLDANRLAPGAIRGHQRFHQDDRGWIDLAYHFMIDANGNIYEGRDAAIAGDTGTNYDPTSHFLVCCEGNFNEQPLPDAQREALVAVLAWAAQRFDVAPSTIRGHRDVAATSCPGDALYALVADASLLDSVDAALAIPYDLIVMDDGESAALVAAIET